MGEMREVFDDYKEIKKEIRAKKEKVRFEYAISKLKECGFDVRAEDANCISIEHKGNKIKIYPYTGWFTGKGVTDGRGLGNLIKQLNSK